MKTGKILPHSGSVLNDIEGRGFSVITDKGKGMIKRNRWHPHVFAGEMISCYVFGPLFAIALNRANKAVNLAIE